MPRPEKPVDKTESQTATNQSEDPSFLYGLAQMGYGLLLLGLSFCIMILSVALFLILISTPIALLLQAVLDVPVEAVPLIGGLAAFGLRIFGGIWWAAEIFANLSLILITVVLLILFFTGRLDELLP